MLQHLPCCTYKESRATVRNFMCLFVVHCNDYYSPHLLDDLFYHRISQRTGLYALRMLLCDKFVKNAYLIICESVMYISFITIYVNAGSSQRRPCFLCCDKHWNLPRPLKISIGLLEIFVFYLYCIAQLCPFMLEILL